MMGTGGLNEAGTPGDWFSLGPPSQHYRYVLIQDVQRKELTRGYPCPILVDECNQIAGTVSAIVATLPGGGLDMRDSLQ